VMSRGGIWCGFFLQEKKKTPLGDKILKKPSLTVRVCV